jgi:ABC-2 type transport system permease protein
VKPYLAVLGARFRMMLQYRAAALAGFVTQLFWGSIKIMVLAAFFTLAPEASTMTLVQAVSYVWLGQALLALQPWNVDGEIAGAVRTGGVAYELLRPLDLYAMWFARTLAFRAAGTALRMAPMFVFAMVLLPLAGFGEFSLRPPASAPAFACFLASVTLTVLLSAAITMLMHVMLVVTISGDGANRLVPGVVSVFSGLVVPLPLFPELLQPLLFWQPFRGLADVPFRFWTGHLAVADAPVELALQAFWVLAFVVAGRVLLASAVRRMVVQGG